MESSSWHLDKKVPIFFVLGILLQTITFAYIGTTWKSDVDNRLNQLEKGDLTTTVLDTRNRLLILEQRFEFIKDTLKDIKEAVKKGTP